MAACSSGGGASGNDGAARSDESAPLWQDVPLVADGVRDSQQLWLPTDTELRPGGSALFAFERPGIDPECVAAATLEASITTDGDPVVAWVSLEDGLVDMAAGASLGNGVIAQGSPWTRPEVDGDVMTWDVAELVRWSLENQPADRYLVLALQPDAVRADRGPSAAFGASEGGAPAVLRVAETPSCAPR
jgi:hypothetical protein